MSRRISLTVILVLLFVCPCRAVSADFFADENQAEVLYGQGVHKFFDRDYKGAIAIFDRVESLASEDPRPYYFKAIALYRLNAKSADADKYFKLAAKLEWEGRAVREYNVPDAIRRIQGNERLHVEKYRTDAKVAWQKTESARNDIKYGYQKQRDKEIVADVSRSFVGTADFGANTPDPLNINETNNKTQDGESASDILDEGEVLSGEVTDTIDIQTIKKTVNDELLQGKVHKEGELILTDEDIFAEFDNDTEPANNDTEPTDNNESESTPKGEEETKPANNDETETTSETETETATENEAEATTDTDTTAEAEAETDVEATEDKLDSANPPATPTEKNDE
ncbi:MAG: hypothetical protein LBQ66_01595 [Planctomycetaceae bacterium]|nr:hypothetical protein [Planctomycetaceae bacterium]